MEFFWCWELWHFRKRWSSHQSYSHSSHWQEDKTIAWRRCSNPNLEAAADDDDDDDDDDNDDGDDDDDHDDNDAEKKLMLMK